MVFKDYSHLIDQSEVDFKTDKVIKIPTPHQISPPPPKAPKKPRLGKNRFAYRGPGTGDTGKPLYYLTGSTRQGDRENNPIFSAV